MDEAMAFYKQKLFGRTDSAVQITHWYKARLVILCFEVTH